MRFSQWKRASRNRNGGLLDKIVAVNTQFQVAVEELKRLLGCFAELIIRVALAANETSLTVFFLATG